MFKSMAPHWLQSIRLRVEHNLNKGQGHNLGQGVHGGGEEMEKIAILKIGRRPVGRSDL